MTDLEQLRAKYPDWQISQHGVEVPSGPGFYYVHAERGAEEFNAATLAELDTLIRGADALDVESEAADLVRDKPSAAFTVRRVLRRYREGTMGASVAMSLLRSARS